MAFVIPEIPAVISVIEVASVDVSDVVASRPIRLVVASSPTEITVKVIGETTFPTSAEYLLEVTDQVSGNRSVQKGRAFLLSGMKTHLIELKLRVTSKSKWTAKLTVKQDNYPTYVDQKTAT